MGRLVPRAPAAAVFPHMHVPCGFNKSRDWLQQGPETLMQVSSHAYRMTGDPA